MAVVLPVLAAFSTISAAGGIAAAVSTVGGFLSVAGGVLAGVGALTGKEDLVKIGGLMTLGSAAAGAIGGANAAGNAGSVVDATGGMETAVEAVNNGGALAQATAQPLGKTSLGTPEQALGQPAQALGQPPSILQQASLQQPPVADTALQLGQSGGVPPVQALDPVSQAGAGMDSGTMQSILESAWNKTRQLGSGVSDFMRNNKEVVQLGGSMLQSMYGPDAEVLDQRQSILDRRRRNLRSPVALGITGG